MKQTKHSRTVWKAAILCALLAQFGCNLNEESVGVVPIKAPEPGIPGGDIKAAIIRSDGVNYPSFWNELNTSWQRYGTEQISIDYTSLNHQNITEADLIASGADVILIDDARNPLVSHILSAAEVNAIVSYTRSGHGLIITGGTFRPAEHMPLMSLVGFSSNAYGGVYFGETWLDSVVISENHPSLFRNIPAYTTSSRNFYSGSDWNRDGKSSYPEDWRRVVSDPNAHIIGFVWNLNHLVNQKQCSPISYMETASYRAVFAGFRPSGWNATQNDSQFYYNAIVWCKK